MLTDKTGAVVARVEYRDGKAIMQSELSGLLETFSQRQLVFDPQTLDLVEVSPDDGEKECHLVLLSMAQQLGLELDTNYELDVTGAPDGAVN